MILLVCSYRNAVFQFVLRLLDDRLLEESVLGKQLLGVKNALLHGSMPTHSKYNTSNMVLDLPRVFPHLVGTLNMIYPPHAECVQEDAHEFLMRILLYLQSTDPICKRHDSETIVPCEANLEQQLLRFMSLDVLDVRTRLAQKDMTPVCACCNTCGHSLESTSLTTDLVWDVTLAEFAADKDQRIFSLESLLRHDLQTETRVADDKDLGFECASERTHCSCRFSVCEVSKKLTQVNRHLCLRLGRNFSTFVKNHLQVRVGPVLEIPVQMNAGADEVQQARYRLVAAVLHSGNSLARGHYACLYRHSTGVWTFYNDSEMAVLGTCEGVPNPPGWDINRHAYLLLYARDTVRSKNQTAGVTVSTSLNATTAANYL